MTGIATDPPPGAGAMATHYADIVGPPAFEGQRGYTRAACELLRKVRPDLAARVTEAGFSEPLLFAALSDSDGVSCSLDELLSSYLPGGSRPKSGDPVLVGPSGIELMERGHPLFEPLYIDERRALPQVRVDGLTDAHRQHVDTALARLTELVPDYSELIFAVTRKIVLHQGDAPNSFAAPRAHGAVFINTALGQDEVFFVEDLAHQCGHVVMSAASFDRNRWFSIDPDVPLSSITAHASEERSVYVLLHGVFTEAAMADALDRWYERGGLSRRQRHEVWGRLAFVVKRLALDLPALVHGQILSDEGRHLVRAFVAVSSAVIARRPELVAVRFENQGYNFDYNRFVALNPPPVAAEA